MSLSKKNKNEKAKSVKLEYAVVTQVVISLGHNQCNVPAATKKVTEQVGYELIILDCKCFPLLTSEGTSGQDFWKSQRKLLAASSSSSVYERLTGKSTKVELTEAAAVDLTIDEPTEKKMKSDSAEG